MSRAPKRPWYRWRWLPLVLALLSVAGGLVAYLRQNVVVVDEIEVHIIDVDAATSP